MTWDEIHKSPPVLITAPTAEPVSLGVVKTWLRVQELLEPARLGALITAARRKVEDDTTRRLLMQTWDQWVDRFPEEIALTLPLSPLQSVTHVKAYDIVDVETTFAASNYLVDTASEPPRLVLTSGSNGWPSDRRRANAGVVRMVLGYADGTAISVSTLTRSEDVATVTTGTAHGYATGDLVRIAGAAQLEFNGLVEIVVTGATTFEYVVLGEPGQPATGTITVARQTVPRPLVEAVLLLATNWYGERTDGRGRREPWGYDDLIAPYRTYVIG